ncbi:ABC transporter substrate-binding protein [Desulfosporosinus sp.]|uniref:ABC transporter substrate-binding protein n=1 Tax=Desulfosporosinus sp. TaxID=157907 RepID=UPI0025C5826C|nr:ABC transporter substrate-binding protein [Desulfosporosinus sp.]MBC2721517.1 ABC transporter substrate-binding protein [Desulfosporosinus sp.]MBC2726641.1 ABC transporter substrate-binding protein [Desulfosporosinus sp.]
MKLIKNLWLVLSISVLLVVSGCGTKSTASDTAPAASTEVKTVNIGYTGPMSGGAALYGKDVTDGLDMAVEEINAKGININGQKYKINLIKLDDQYMPDKAATNARRLRAEYDTPIIFIPHSGGIFALQQFNETDGFGIMAYTSEPKISKTGNKLTLQLPPPNDLYPHEFSKIVMDRFGKKLALIPTTTQYGKDWSSMIIPAWEKLGGTIVSNNPVDYNKEVDFNTFISKALAANPDVLFIGGPSQPTAKVVKQARQLGFKGGFIVMDQAKLDQMADIVPMTDLEGSVGVCPIANFDTPGTAPFVERYKAKYAGKIPASEQTYNYEHMILLAKGMEKAGNVTDAAKIFEGMKGVMPLSDPSLVHTLYGIGLGGASMTNGAGIVIENGKFNKPFAIKNPLSP